MVYLHERNIIMGDINALNILVVSPTEVYFVDTDSYQIEEFPCPVWNLKTPCLMTSFPHVLSMKRDKV